MYAADHGARIANLSFGASTSLTLSNAALNFQTRGGVLTVSAGNDAFFNPAPDNPYEIVVSATDSADALASWSNTGNNVDVCAPGVNILTTARGGGYGYGTGTSFSAPLVAGVAALVVSANPSLTGAQVRDILKQSADDLGSPGWDPSYGWGRINADKAVLAATGATPTDTTPPASTIAAPLAGGTVSGVATIAVTATDDVGVTKVECYINGALAGSSAIAPATFPWDTAAYANGSYTLQARAYDAAGNVGASATVSVSVQNGVPDLTAPTAQVTSPANASTVTGVANIDVSAVDNVGVTKVECYINGTLVGTSAAAPATFSWNTATYANGSYTVQARASDAAGNVGASATVSVSVQNPVADTVAPAVRITSPTNGVTVGKSTKVYVLATDNVGVTRVDLLVDGKFYATSALAAPVFSWTTSKLSRGSHTLQAVAYDAAGNTTRSTVVTIKK